MISDENMSQHCRQTSGYLSLRTIMSFSDLHDIMKFWPQWEQLKIASCLCILRRCSIKSSFVLKFLSAKFANVRAVLFTSHQMCSQITAPWKVFKTITTHVPFFTKVHFRVLSTIFSHLFESTSKNRMIYIATNMFFLIMNLQVFIVVTFDWKFLTTVATFVWFFTCMNFHMIFQNLWISKFFITYITFIWLFPSVRSAMIIQSGGSRKFFITDVTTKQQFSIMNLGMFQPSWSRYKHFRTILASEHFSTF